MAALNASDRTVTAWNPSPNSSNNEGLAISSDGQYVYVGGWFNTVAGQTRNRLPR